MDNCCHRCDFFISTHSLTRRLTSFKCFNSIHSIHFNSQPHKEADWQLNILRTFRNYFNSQPHKEADYSTPNSTAYSTHFNSQPHKEADRG